MGAVSDTRQPRQGWAHGNAGAPRAWAANWAIRARSVKGRPYACVLHCLPSWAAQPVCLISTPMMTGWRGVVNVPNSGPVRVSPS
jgi:hypothetical protein